MTMKVFPADAWPKMRLVLSTLTVILGALALTPAKAEILSISGATFFQQCSPACAPSGGVPTLDRGVLKATDVSKFYASVEFPIGGQQICSFSIVYQDVNGNENMTARLFRKTFTLGGNVFNNPLAVATVNSANGVVQQVRKATTTAISPRGIAKGNSFYYVEIFFPTINLALIGVQIDYRPTCPA